MTTLLRVGVLFLVAAGLISYAVISEGLPLIFGTRNSTDDDFNANTRNCRLNNNTAVWICECSDPNPEVKLNGVVILNICPPKNIGYDTVWIQAMLEGPVSLLGEVRRLSGLPVYEVSYNVTEIGTYHTNIVIAHVNGSEWGLHKVPSKINATTGLWSDFERRNNVTDDLRPFKAPLNLSNTSLSVNISVIDNNPQFHSVFESGLDTVLGGDGTGLHCTSCFGRWLRSNGSYFWAQQVNGLDSETLVHFNADWYKRKLAHVETPRKIRHVVFLGDSHLRKIVTGIEDVLRDGVGSVTEHDVAHNMLFEHGYFDVQYREVMQPYLKLLFDPEFFGAYNYSDTIVVFNMLHWPMRTDIDNFRDFEVYQQDMLNAIEMLRLLSKIDRNNFLFMTSPSWAPNGYSFWQGRTFAVVRAANDMCVRLLNLAFDDVQVVDMGHFTEQIVYISIYPGRHFSSEINLELGKIMLDHVLERMY